MSHPLRVRILAMLDERTASPVELAGWLGASLGTVAYHVRTLEPARREGLLPGPEHPSPAPPRRRRHSDNQLPALERSQRDVQRSRRELELGRELCGRDGARMAGGDDVERRLLALREVIGEVAGQKSRP